MLDATAVEKFGDLGRHRITSLGQPLAPLATSGARSVAMFRAQLSFDCCSAGGRVATVTHQVSP